MTTCVRCGDVSKAELCAPCEVIILRLALRGVQLERDAANNRVTRMNGALRCIAQGKHVVEEYPDRPVHWEVKLTCVRCRAIGCDIDHLDARHTEDCPVRIARTTLAENKTH